MWNFSKKQLAAFVVTTLAGACLHFLYTLLPTPLTALFSPVNESLWEHLKIFFWPHLVAMMVLTRGGERGTRAPWLLSMVLLSGAMLGSSYVYHILLGGERMVVDLAIYVLAMMVGFLLPGILHPVGDIPIVRDGLALLVLVLAVSIVVFTFLPPDHILFMDLLGVNTWATIPY